MNNNLRLLGIAKKAGLLAAGDEAVYAAAQSGKARAVFSARDAAEHSRKRARKYAEDSDAVYLALPYTKAELGEITGRGTLGMLALLDAGLAASFTGGLAENGPDAYRDAARLLERKAERITRRQKDAAAGGKYIGTGKRRIGQ